jgi:phage terminase small subunit
MRPPKGLAPAGRAAWRHARDTLEAIGERRELSRGAIDRYAFAVDAAAVIRRELRAGELVIAGPRGAVRPNPLIRALERAERQAAE